MGVSLLGRQFVTDEGESLFISDIQVRIDVDNDGQVTRHPVEDGGAISDHVVCEPERISLEMEVSNNPVCGVDPTNPDVGFAGTENRVSNAYQRLRQIKKNKRVFNVQSKLGIHRNMVIESFSTSQDNRTCEILRFRANLVSVDIVGSETIGIQQNAASEALQGPITRGDVATLQQTLCDTFVISEQLLDCCDLDPTEYQECLDTVTSDGAIGGIQGAVGSL